MFHHYGLFGQKIQHPYLIHHHTPFLIFGNLIYSLVVVIVFAYEQFLIHIFSVIFQILTDFGLF